MRPSDNRNPSAYVQPIGYAIQALMIGVCCLAPFMGAAATTSDPAKDPEMSIFGVGPCSMHVRDFPKWMPQMTAIGIRDLRSFGGSWGVEPEPGKWDWKGMDERLTYLESLNVQAGVLLLGHPKWLTKDAKGLPLNSLPEWSTYVYNVVAHTKGRVKYFEVWNEPPNGTGKATAEDYGKVVVASYDAAKKANPDALVGIAAKSVALNYLDAAIKSGAKGHFDYLTLHPYEVLGTVVNQPGYEAMFMSIAPTTRKMLAAQDPSKVGIPIIFTEIGYNAGRNPGKQAEAVIKCYTMGIAQGIACIQWFEGMDGDSGPMGLLKADGTPRPAYTALGELVKLLGRHPGYLGWVLFNNKHYGFVFQGAKGPALVTWAATSTPDSINFGRSVQVIDPQTSKISQATTYKLTLAPILVDGVPEALVAQAKANKGKPFPWGGDYSNAKSVSVTFADKYEEKGLHTMAGDAIAADVLAYGGNQRAGELPKGGNVFYVDPNFLSYTSVPIEITAMVKRNPNNDAARISLEYESNCTPLAYKKVAPYEIPDNKEWHKATWKITDSQFVGTWAFNFRLNTGKYHIQSVTVTKLDK